MPLRFAPRPTLRDSWKSDLPASLVVVLVALPLCLGIALASGAPLAAGIVAGVIGGILVGLLSNSQLMVSGPAAGLTAIVFTGIATNVCVESSLRDAFHLEYFGVVLEDATHAAGPDFAQKAALYNIETFFGWVSTVADFCGAIGQSSE